jgi:hypothetical protein
MDIGFFRSPIEAVAITLCLAGSIFLYKQMKHYSAVLVCIGFAVVLITHMSVNYCIGVALVGADYLQDYPYLCSPVIPYIRSGGYFLIGYGLIQLSEHFKNV